MKKSKWLFFGVIFVITIIYTLYNVVLIGIYYYRDMPLWIRFGNKVLVIALVYGIGFWLLKKMAVPWMINVWNLIYFSTGFCLIFLALFQSIVQVASVQITNIVHTIMDILISPLLLLSLGFIQYRISMAK